MQLIRDLLRPYRAWLAIILLALLVETAMSLAGPWPLKIVLDSVVGRHPLPEWIVPLFGNRLADDRLAIAAAAAAGLVLIGLFGSVASYADKYYTESVSQWVANDLRMRVFHQLDRLSLAYYDTQQTGGLLSTITTDISTIQDFASEATRGPAGTTGSVLPLISPETRRLGLLPPAPGAGRPFHELACLGAALGLRGTAGSLPLTGWARHSPTMLNPAVPTEIPVSHDTRLIGSTGSRVAPSFA